MPNCGTAIGQLLLQAPVQDGSDQRYSDTKGSAQLVGIRSLVYDSSRSVVVQGVGVKGIDQN